MARHLALFYDYVPDVVERRRPYREDHLGHVREAKEAGRIVMAGALGEPPHGGLLVFGDIDVSAIEAFVEADPYVRGGLVRDWRIEPWNLV
jgi:uncharacterized protein